MADDCPIEDGTAMSCRYSTSECCMTPTTVGRSDLIAVLSDWRARYGRVTPEADEMIAALDRRGITLTDKAHAGCAAAVEHVAEHHHGPDYPKCAAAWAAPDAGQVERAARAIKDEWRASMPAWWAVADDAFRRLAAAALSSLAGEEQHRG